MTMPWFRMYNESRNDRKLDTLADDEFRVWHKLLCCASEGKDRGSIEAEDRELLAIEVARGDEDLLGRTLARLAKLKIIRDDGDSILFINFLKRNYDKPSDTPQATAERQRRHREKGRDEGVTETVSRDVTPGHAQEEIRREEKRVEETRGERGVTPPAPTRLPTPAPKRADARPALPSAEQLVDDLREWADAKGVRDILADEVERFRDYCLSGKNGKPVAYADYVAACRKWITNPNYGHAPSAIRTTPNGHSPPFEPIGRDRERVAVMERFKARRGL